MIESAKTLHSFLKMLELPKALTTKDISPFEF